MNGLPIGFLIESVVSVLLVITIGYCYILNKRLVSLKADKETMRDMIADLVAATTMANSAIIVNFCRVMDKTGRRLPVSFWSWHIKTVYLAH